MRYTTMLVRNMCLICVSKRCMLSKDKVQSAPMFLYLGCVLICLIFLHCMSSVVDNQVHSLKIIQYNQFSSNATPEFAHNSNSGIVKSNQQDMSNISVDDMIENFIPNVKITTVNCAALIRGDKEEIKKVTQYQGKNTKKFLRNADFLHLTKNCSRFIQERKYTVHPLSKEEMEFPLGFSVLIFNNLEQFERLLRAIYRPQNYYCVHVDAKSSEVMWEATNALVNCFSNVFMASKSVRVMWGTYSVLEPEFVCMGDLWKFKNWRYFINLTGHEFPLQTMGSIVQILKILKGANNAEGTIKRKNKMRTKFIRHNDLLGLHIEKFPPPVPVTITKGSVHIIAQRGFVGYVLHDKQALKFREWVKDTGVPDETFFSSLIYSPQLEVPGAYLGEPETDKIDSKYPRNPFIARFKNWGNSIFNWTCHGRKMRGICVFGAGDLKILSSRRELFANKFLLQYQPLTYDCMEEFYYNKTIDDIKGITSIDTSFYSNLDIVENHL